VFTKQFSILILYLCLHTCLYLYKKGYLPSAHIAVKNLFHQTHPKLHMCQCIVYFEVEVKTKHKSTSKEKVLLKLSSHSVQYSEENKCHINTLCTSEALLLLKSHTKQNHYFILYLCMTDSALCVYKEPNIYAVQLKKTEHHDYHQSLYCD
jgi:hypothetical protein